MSTQIPTPPSLPHVGRRRKGPKTLPRLPLSAFSPPNSGTSEQFPLPPSPSMIHPDSVVDAHVVAAGDLSHWKQEAGEVLGGRIGGVILSLQDKEPAEIENIVAGFDIPVISVLVPFSLDTAPPADPPSYLPGSAKIPTSLSAIFSKIGPDSVPALSWALQHSQAVDLDVRSDGTQSDALWESLEELLTNATKATEGQRLTPIVLSNVLPPPHDLTLPIVKFITHPSYHAYQSHTAALSLFPNLYVKFLPPAWDAPTPPTPPASATFERTDSKEKKEWKRRIKMYLGPVVEAFGYERIIFGSSRSSTSDVTSNAGDWYEIARESFAELGVDQGAMDAVFSANAKKVYGSSS